MILEKDHIKVVAQKIERQVQWLVLLLFMQTPKKLCILLKLKKKKHKTKKTFYWKYILAQQGSKSFLLFLLYF